MLWLRRASALVTVALVFACATTSTSSDGSEANQGRQRDSASSAAHARSGSGQPEAVSLQSKTLSAPVAVVSLTAAEASPCEQMCGRVGDCLDDREPLEASHLEISCLDLCVNVREDSDEANAFRSCKQRSSCGELVQCVDTNWSAAQLAQVEFDTLVDASAVDTCDLYCRGIYGCMYYDKTVAQGVEFTNDTERELQACVETCDPDESQAIDLATCAMEPACIDFWTCFEEAQSVRYP